jgi:Pectinesterase.
MNKLNFRWEKGLLYLLILGMVLGITAGSSFAAGTIFVSTQGNDAWNGLAATFDPSTGNGPKATIQNAINTVTDNGTVSVAAGTYKENLYINKDVYLEGAGPDSTIIDGMRTESVIRLFESAMEPFNQFALTVNGFTLTNGNGTYGGGIYNYGGILFLINTEITGNMATHGGGLYNDGTTSADSATSITDNSPDEIYGYPITPLSSGDISQDVLPSVS